MIYNINFFEITKEKDKYTKYSTLIKTGFYNIYSDGPNDYHMALEDKESIFERAYFYKKYISHLKEYPLYTKNNIQTTSNPNSLECMLQVLSLPPEIFYVEINGKKQQLSIDEALARIHFENFLINNYDKSLTFNNEVTSQNSIANIQLINYLLKHGIFFHDIDLLFYKEINRIKYPVFLDINKIPSYFLRKVTKEELLLNYSSNYRGKISLNQYRQSFTDLTPKNIDRFFTFAFKDETKDDQRAFKNALQNYFITLLSKVASDFYKNYYDSSLFISNELNINTKIKDKYHLYFFGNSFNMVQEEKYIVKGTDKLSLTYNKSDYLFLKSNKERIKFAYKLIHNHFKMHPEYKFSSIFFAYYMGLPYQALNNCLYFDFEKGTADDFINLYSFAEHENCLSSYFSNAFRTETIIALDEKHDIDTYYSYSANAFTQSLNDDNLYFLSEQVIENSEILKDNTKLIEDFLYLYKDEHFLIDILSHNPRSGYFLIKEIIILLNDGYSIKNVAELKSLPYLELDKFINKLYEYLNNYTTNIRASFYNSNSELSDDSLAIKNAYLGNKNLIFYKDNKYYFAKEDKEILTIYEKLYNKYFLKTNIKYNPADKFFLGLKSVTSIKNSEKNIYKAIAVTGLEKDKIYSLNLDFNKDIVPQLTFIDGCDFFDEKHQEIIKANDELLNIQITRNLLKKGIYLKKEFMEEDVPFYYLEDRLPDEYKFYFSYSFLFILFCQNYIFNHQVSLKKERFLASEENFKKLIIDLLDNNENKKYPYYIYMLREDLKNMFYYSEKEKITSIPSKYFLDNYYDKKLNLYVRPGTIFNSFSKTGIEDSFFFKEEDRSKINLAVQASSIYPYKLQTDDLIIAENAIMTGLPLKTIVEIFAIATKRMEPKIIYRFENIKIDDSEINISSFYTLTSTYDNFINSSYFKKILINDGIFYFDYCYDIYSDETHNLSELFHNAINYLSDCPLYIDDNLKNYADKIFKPDFITFNYLLNSFLTLSFLKYFNNYFLLYLKEVLEYLYLKDKLFIIKLISKLQFTSSSAYISTLKRNLKSFSFPLLEPSINMSELVAAITIFLLYIQLIYISNTRKKLKK